MKHGAVKEVAEQFNIGRNTVIRIWKQGIKCLYDGNNVIDVSSRKKVRGRKKRHNSWTSTHPFY